MPSIGIFKNECIVRFVFRKGNVITKNTHSGQGTMNRELRDVVHLADLDTAIIVNAALELGACVVFAESEKFQPVAAMVFQGPGHKSDLLWIMIETFSGVFADASHLLGMGDRIDLVAGAGRDEIDHLETFPGKCFAHQNV